MSDWPKHCIGRNSDTPLVPTQSMQSIIRLFAWLALAALVFVTVCPIGLRPVSGEPVWLERSAAYAVLALLFTLGYPRQRFFILALTVAVAGVLEASQALQASRHGRLPDFYIKAAGCVAGWLVACTVVAIVSGRRRFHLERPASSQAASPR